MYKEQNWKTETSEIIISKESFDINERNEIEPSEYIQNKSTVRTNDTD